MLLGKCQKSVQKQEQSSGILTQFKAEQWDIDVSKDS